MNIESLMKMTDDESLRTFVLLSLKEKPLFEEDIMSVCKELNEHLISAVLLDVVLKGNVNVTFESGKVVYIVKSL